jgi:hypothetical protein
MAVPKRSQIPYDVQVRVFFRDKWLCWLCGRPTIFAPALKYVDRFVKDQGYSRPTAYHSDAWRRDKSPLLLEMAAVVDHVTAHIHGGPSTVDNLRTAHQSCNMRKSAEAQEAYTARNPKRRVKSQYGEPEHWDGFVSLFMVLAPTYKLRLTATERCWFESFEKFFLEEGQKGGFFQHR